MNCKALSLALGCALLPPSIVAAQESRAEEIAAKQKAKAAVLHPYEPTRFEQVVTRLEESFASPPDGIYPVFGTVYPGGGISGGAGYRQFFARDTVWNTHALVSIKGYKLFESGVSTTPRAGRNWDATVKAGWIDATEVAFFGIGMNDPGGRANFHLSQGYGRVAGSLRPARLARLSLDLGYEDFKTQPGRGRRPSIEVLYDPSPPVSSSVAFARATATAAIDSRPSASYTRSGGFYGLTLANYSDVDGTYSFRRGEAEIIQHVPLHRETWVLSIRGRVQTTLDDEDRVPYFLLPELGSGGTLRAYSHGRFRDRHSILTSAEFRWTPSRTALDMAVFYDAGKVTGRRSELDFSDLKTDWGIGARLHGPGITFLRLEAAHGSEGWRTVMTTSAPF